MEASCTESLRRPTLSHPPARSLLGNKSTSLLNRLLVLSPQHVHVHVLPRKLGDFERNDSVYDEVSIRIFDCLFRRQMGGATHTGPTWNANMRHVTDTEVHLAPPQW